MLLVLGGSLASLEATSAEYHRMAGWQSKRNGTYIPLGEIERHQVSAPLSSPSTLRKHLIIKQGKIIKAAYWLRGFSSLHHCTSPPHQYPLPFAAKDISTNLNPRQQGTYHATLFTNMNVVQSPGILLNLPSNPIRLIKISSGWSAVENEAMMKPDSAYEENLDMSRAVVYLDSSKPERIPNRRSFSRN